MRHVRFADDDITRVGARNQTNASIFYLLQDGEGGLSGLFKSHTFVVCLVGGSVT